MMRVLAGLFCLHMRRAAGVFARSLSDPHNTQQKRLNSILHNNVASAIGKEYDFASIHDMDTFRARLPIRTYDEYEDTIQKIRHGTQHLLTTQPVTRFNITSGTTATPKFCPVTRAFTLEHHRMHLLWLHRLIHDRPAVATGRYLTLLSPASSGHTPGGIPFGASSGQQYLNQAWPIRRRHAVPYPAYQISDYASRYYCILLHALGVEDLSVVTTVNPSTLVHLSSLLQQYAEELLDDLAHGTIRHAPALQPDEQPTIHAYLHPHKKRARLLQERLRTDGQLLPHHAWPHLASIHCWQGGSAPFYLKQIAPLWGDAPQRCLGLRASEGTFSLPMSDHTPDGVLAIGGHIMEFLGEHTPPAPDAHTLLPHELEEGKRYRLIVTTAGGFYRYDMGDIVEVTGFRHKTPVVRFLHKAGHVLSITGEKVTENQVVLAMRHLASGGISLAGFTVTLELTQPPRLLLAVEPTAPLPEDNAKKLSDAFDRELAFLNPEYKEKRASGRLANPRLLHLAPGTYAAYRARQADSGRPDGQIKPPHLLQPAGEGPGPVRGCPFFDQAQILHRIT